MMNYVDTRHSKSRWVRLFISSSRWKVLVIGVILLGLVWIYASRIPASNAGVTGPPSPQVGFAAPDLTLDTLDGEAISLSNLRGKVILINVWASWCPPCRAEMPAIDAVYRKYREASFVVLAVNLTSQDSEADARAFAQSLGLTFPILLDRDGATSRRYKVQALPTSFFVGRDGTIRDIVIGGPMNEALIASKVEGLLAEEKR